MIIDPSTLNPNTSLEEANKFKSMKYSQKNLRIHVIHRDIYINHCTLYVIYFIRKLWNCLGTIIKSEQE